MRILLITALLAVTATITRGATPPIVEESMLAHGIEAWWNQQAVEATVTIEFGGLKVLDSAEFYFEAHGPRARYQQDGVTVVYDGTTAWVSPPEAATPKNRFHVWTWPWFIYAPLKLDGDGITLSDEKALSLRGTDYDTWLQTFGASEGDAPDDWYRLYMHPETKGLDAMAYIVTFGKSAEEANKTPSIILYSGYEEFNGVQLATEYEFWHLTDQLELHGDGPKGNGQVTNIQLHGEIDEAMFAIPDGAVEVDVPPATP